MGADNIEYRVTGAELRDLARAMADINYHEIAHHIEERTLNEFIFSWRTEVANIMARFEPCGIAD